MGPDATLRNDGKGRIANALRKVNEAALRAAFSGSVFVYGTGGTGSMVVKGLKAWAGRSRRAKKPGDAHARPGIPDQGKVIERELNLFEPGRRATAYLTGDRQMMDLYYGQAGTNLHLRRIPAIAEFVHHAMAYTVPFSMQQSGRLAFQQTFKTKEEGWWGSSAFKYGDLTPTKEISRIIRWGIKTFGGEIIFEGKEVYYSQVFYPAPARISDTDAEARELFTYFTRGVPQAPFGKGVITFHWCGKRTVPTKLHFLSNWTWAQDDGKATSHQLLNHAKSDFKKPHGLLPIWDNFLDFPAVVRPDGKASALQVVIPD